MSSIYASNPLVIRGRATGAILGRVANVNAGLDGAHRSGPARPTGPVYPDQTRACSDLSLPFDPDWARGEIVDCAMFAAVD